MATLKEILNTPRFSELTLLNQHADLERPLDTIEISETPDIAYYMPPNAFLVTTAMAFENNPDSLCDLVRSLAELPSAGLAIKVGRFLTSVDPAVLKVADELAFPIIKIPMHMTLGDISHKLLSYIWNDQTEQIFFSLEIQQKFVNLMMHGASLDTLITQLSSMIKQSVLLVDSFGEIACSSLQFSNYDLLKEEKKERFLEEVKQYQREKSKQTFLYDFGQGEKTLVSVFPINTDHYFPYMLVIFEPEQLPYPFSQFAIKQSVTVLTLAIYKEQTIQTEKKLERRNLLSYLLNHSRIVEDKNWLEYKRHFPILNSIYYRIISIENLIPLKIQYYSKEIDALVYDYLFTHIENRYQNIMIFPTQHLNQWVFLVQKKINISPILEEIHHHLYDLLGVFLRFGIGDPVNNIDLLHFSYNESQNALTETNDHEYIYHNRVQGIKRITENISTEDMRYFCISILKSLAYPDNPTDSELRKTLMTYLDNQCEITKTSDQLFIHRNTVKYRIKKCEELFNNSIADPEFSLQLRVALLLSDSEK